MSDVTLTLGDFTFADSEIPESMKVRTAQKTVVHRMVGGARTVQTLGADHAPIVWSGILLGSNALDRALTLKGMNDAGLPLYLFWSEFYYQVIVSELELDMERVYQIPYTVTCTVVQDMTAPIYDTSGVSMDDLINGDMQTCTALTASIGDPATSASVFSLNSAIASVSSFANATRATINSVLTPLNTARTQVQTLIASTENTLQSVSTLGGVLPNNPVAHSVANLNSQINAMENQTNLVQLNSVLGRMGTNLGQIGTGVKSINVGGGTLFDLASKYYGKVSGWTAISQANPQLGGDTNITGNQSIVIPPYAGDSGGVLNA